MTGSARGSTYTTQVVIDHRVLCLPYFSHYHSTNIHYTTSVVLKTGNQENRSRFTVLVVWGVGLYYLLIVWDDGQGPHEAAPAIQMNCTRILVGPAQPVQRRRGDL